jgi:hypothetical protein
MVELILNQIMYFLQTLMKILGNTLELIIFKIFKIIIDLHRLIALIVAIVKYF